MTTQHTPRRGIIAQLEQDRIEAEQLAGEHRYYASVMADELSNDRNEEDFDE